MPHPRKRSWSLATLDPELTYRLWLDPVAFRWEVDVVGTASESADARAVAERRAARTAGASAPRADRPPLRDERTAADPAA